VYRKILAIAVFLNIYEEDTHTRTQRYGHGSIDVMLQIRSAFAVTDEVG
jgi:hypothetical protein